MADLGNYNDKLIQDDETQQQNGASNTVTPTAGTSGVVTGAQGSGASTAGVGAGGTGGWTNIQAYLGANKADNGAAGLLNDKAQGQYDKENTALQTQASDAKTQAEGEANKINEAKDNSKQWVNQAANAYDWSGNHGDPYKQNVGKLQTALNGQYQGPQNFAYGTSADFQKTQSALGDNSAFSNYMNDIYKNKAGGQLSAGQGALQTQLDVNNQNLADARANLLKQYSGFGDIVNNTAKDTDAAIQTAKTLYGNNQQGLKTFLQNMGNDYQTQIDKAEADARAAYQNEYKTGKSGLANAANDANYLAWREANEINVGGLPNMSYWGNDLTWDQLQQEKDAGGQKSSYGVSELQNLIDRQNRNASALDNFYTTQDAKYANTADEQERNWNTIMDILNNTGDRKKQGFAVRG